MSRLLRHNTVQAFRVALCLTLFAIINISLASCRKTQNVAAARESQKTFASPQEAGAALLEAAKSGDQAALLEIFGPEGNEVLFSGDPVKDKKALNDFSIAYETMNRWGEIKAGGQILYVGIENFPFPVPLQQNSNGQWFFNTDAGADEILARRIGKDELVAIAALGAIASAEQQYFNQKPAGNKVNQYAETFVSDPGKRNGLYWQAADGQAKSPLGQLGDFAKGAGYTNPGQTPQPFSGYYFQILTKQGEKAKGGAKDYIVNGKMTRGFAVLAYPAEYRNSGIMTFLIGKDGVVYEKDLREGTVDTAKAITEYNPGDGWTPVND